ncbi:MAG: hypothetical protein U9R38_07245 [Candidatus Margulisiibacteriota bacterium]|nr:hypothetical protein [Candidatus Margulisiibacteriota bacterium]
MKKILILLFVIIYAAASFAANLADKKAELSRVKKYIRSLDAKIVAARSARKINKLAELKDLKRRQLERAKLIRKDIAELETGEKKPEVKKEAKPQPKPDEGKRGRQFEVGYGGGTLLLGSAYSFPFRNLNLQAKAGYGIGNGYSILDAGIRALFAVRGNKVGVELGMANYSETVADILGVAGNIDKGTKLGFGVFLVRPVFKYTGRIGYNTALGLTASLLYKF